VYSTLLFSSCYSNLLLRRRGWAGILRRWVLGYVLPRLSFLWCYGVFRCSVPLRVIIVFRDTIYVIIILYSWHLVIYEHFWSYVWNNWSWVMHTMSTWFWHKNQVWQRPCACSEGAHLSRYAAILAILPPPSGHLFVAAMWMSFSRYHLYDTKKRSF
jgi:hypothetical protein